MKVNNQRMKLYLLLSKLAIALTVSIESNIPFLYVLRSNCKCSVAIEPVMLTSCILDVSLVLFAYCRVLFRVVLLYFVLAKYRVSFLSRIL
jgi:hypothetical protein